MNPAATCFFTSPVGYIICTASDTGLSSLSIRQILPEDLGKNQLGHPFLTQTRIQVEEYLEGKRQTFEVPLDFGPASKFFQSVWNILLTIPYGHTRSYGEIAKQLGDINKSRAVGMANGRNPIGIIVPCHRVIGSDHSLTGYAGGIEVKRKLLELESPKKWSLQSEMSF
ncbi:MAG: methylated-DNA--[protein]-cysteine S-methyltransferase [Saprospiraceae bacterium]|nr:methylated-DNA--[protein]-cysteine S-methyltransferase [Saprospiraceae bacterium]MBK7608605.1 methylated-DNA--[protein]-cysteine S-methyltransferase [Saprospiraceae bacterium]MBK8776407.1 methylated-DNA--[protein]-cysteine S-methyltransferase [Saprospiraceae bacterium]